MFFRLFLWFTTFRQGKQANKSLRMGNVDFIVGGNLDLLFPSAYGVFGVADHRADH